VGGNSKTLNNIILYLRLINVTWKLQLIPFQVIYIIIVPVFTVAAFVFKLRRASRAFFTSQWRNLTVG